MLILLDISENNSMRIYLTKSIYLFMYYLYEIYTHSELNVCITFQKGFGKLEQFSKKKQKTKTKKNTWNIPQVGNS